MGDVWVAAPTQHSLSIKGTDFDSRRPPSAAGCPGLLHVAGYALDKHALFVVCDGTCAKTFLR